VAIQSHGEGYPELPGHPRTRYPLHLSTTPPHFAVSRKLRYRDDGVERHLVRGRHAVTRRLRLTRADWQATQAVPAEIGCLGALPALFWLGS
jgi:hypothetical protein